MLLRLALLAMLYAVSPMPFAMYASESTAHWTKTWVGMFLGVTFQQVVTLALILGLADKAPDLVNPAGRGLFSSAGTALKTGAAAAGGGRRLERWRGRGAERLGRDQRLGERLYGWRWRSGVRRRRFGRRE